VNQYRTQHFEADHLNAVRERHKLSIAQIDQAIQAYLRVEQAAMLAADSVVVSEADIQDFVRQTSEKVKVRMVLIDSTQLVDAAYTPTDDELKAQFDKYKDQPAGGPSEYGYQLPEATQIEYIEINADELAKSQSVTEDDAYAYWTAHKNEFTRPTSQPATSSAPATRPEPPKAYDTFYEAKGKVREKLAHDKATKVATRLAEELIRQVGQPWVSQPTTQPGGYRQPPASEMASDVYAKLIAGPPSKYGAALRIGRTGLVDAEKLMADPKIGRASAFASTPQRVMFSETAFMVAGLKADRAAEPRHARLFRNVYETCAEPGDGFAGNVYVFRNLAVRPAQPPASFSEVRDKLVTDLRNIRAYGEAGRVARDLTAKAGHVGPEARVPGRRGPGRQAQERIRRAGGVLPASGCFNYGGMPRLMDGFVPAVGRDPS